MSNQAQIDYWNGDAGNKWVAFSEKLDAMLKPFANLVLETAKIGGNDDVIDIGCGAGALSGLAAQSAKSVTGVDISKPLIKLAKEKHGKIENTSFQMCDAQTMQLGDTFDLAISRFGVMFFNDPIAAFSNIRAHMNHEGRLVFACWQSPMKNLWARAPLEAALPFLTEAITTPEPNAPGPFGLADPDFIKDVLKTSGWRSIEISNWSDSIRLPGNDLHESAAFMMKMGPLSRILKEQDIDLAAVQKQLISVLETYQTNSGTVDMSAAIWIVSAEN